MSGVHHFARGAAHLLAHLVLMVHDGAVNV